MRLLIADYDPINLRSFEIYFSSCSDFTIIGLIADGNDAANMCKADNPDVVLLDYRLDCVETTRQIKAHCPNTQVIILALYGSTHEIQQAINAGARGYIAKADGMQNIIEDLRTMMKKSY